MFPFAQFWAKGARDEDYHSRLNPSAIRSKLRRSPGRAFIFTLTIKPPAYPVAFDLHARQFMGSNMLSPTFEAAQEEDALGFDQYHEPANELPQETRTFARIIVSLIEEAEAIDWYEQRLAVEPDEEAKAIMRNSQEEEFKHFGMDLEFLLRRMPKWRAAMQQILFKEGDIVQLGNRGEAAEEKQSGG